MSEDPDAATETEPDAQDPATETGESEPEPVAEGKPASRERPKFTPPPPERLDATIEALLLVAGDVLKLDRLRDLLGLSSRVHVREALERIAGRWAEVGLAVELEEVGGGVRVVTRPEYAEYVARLSRRPPVDKLSKSLLETLSIVAYKQPVGRAEIERIRGVQAGEALRALLERRLVKVVGRSDQPGRPMLYGTTDRFLTTFGLATIKDLPTDGDLKRL